MGLRPLLKVPARRLAGLGTGVVVAATLLGAPAAGAASTTTTTGATTTTTVPAITTAGSRSAAPKTLLAAAIGAAGKEGSVHFVATSTIDTRSLRVTADAGTTVGMQTVVLHEGKVTGQVTGRFVDKVVYFRGDTVGLEDYLGMPSTLAPKYSGQWIAFGSSTQDYTAITQSMELSAAISQISVKAPITGGAHSTQAGQATVTVQGTTTSLSSKGEKGTATLYVAAKGSPLPVVYRGTGKQKKQKETGTVTFSKWGETISPVAPSKSVAASSITT